MINCKRCKFEVLSSMRFSLIKNACPSCGAALFGDSQMKRLDLIKGDLLHQEFSQRMDKDLIFDISLFILSKFYSSGISEQSTEIESIEDPVKDEDDSLIQDTKISKAAPIRTISKPKTLDPYDGLEEFGDSDDEQDNINESLYENGDYESIREQIRNEVLSGSDLDNEDLELKVARLKRVASENNLRKSGVRVSRVSDY